jgi:transcriptional regulator with GAF, ATPase, and Fis domain
VVAPTDATVLIEGETGTGKELVARAIQQRSARADTAFIKINCAAIPSSLLESELLGHERGAFTGAHVRRAGRFELADGGTLFLDEIGEMPLDLQPKLLRVLQEREFERLGGNRTVHTNVRVIAATNRGLDQLVEAQLFRADLYYRLHVFPIRVPALRERCEDIPLLVQHFARLFAKRMNKPITSIDPVSLATLSRYDWPGNIRELQNVVERAVICTQTPVLQLSLLRSGPRLGAATQATDALADVSRAHILRVLHDTNWVVAGPAGAAVRLQMKRSTLIFRMKKLGIVRESDAALGHSGAYGG